MLKHDNILDPIDHRFAAAFGRLCVETMKIRHQKIKKMAAAFGRLCVETSERAIVRTERLAAAFGRLCVETFYFSFRKL